MVFIGFLGFYIVKQEYRGKGYGLQIWNAAMQRLANQNIGLDGVVAQQNNYQKSGFNFAYNNIRYEGKAVRRSSIQPKQMSALSEIPLQQLVQYDAAFFPTSRASFLQAWIQQPESLALGYFEEKQLKGYGVIRKCRRGFKIGPLFADTREIAFTLFDSLQEAAGVGCPIFLDVPEPNKIATRLVNQYNMKPVFQTARMYTQTVPKMDLNKIFGVTTLELG